VEIEPVPQPWTLQSPHLVLTLDVVLQVALWKERPPWFCTTTEAEGLQTNVWGNAHTCTTHATHAHTRICTRTITEK
jgi:hypothetical protein